MSRHILILPMGPLHNLNLQHLARFLEASLGLACQVGDPEDIPSEAYDRNRHQCNSRIILDHLERNASKFFKCIAVTEYDLNIPPMKFVFGLSRINGPCAVVSTHRLVSCPPDPPHAEDQFKKRIFKTVLHELGHCLGLVHCRDRKCVMYPSTRIEDTDLKREYFCTSCKGIIHWILKEKGGGKDFSV